MGSAFTAIGNDPVPATSDAVLIPADVLQYADSISHKIAHWVTDQAERDVLYAAAEAPILVASPTAIWLKISGSGGSSVWKTVWADSGSVTTGFTNITNFQISGGYVRKLYNTFVQFTVNTQRKTSTFASNANGNVVGDPHMFTLPTGYWPALTTPVLIRAFTADFIGEINTAGEVRILSGQASYTVDIDETLVVAGSFFTP